MKWEEKDINTAINLFKDGKKSCEISVVLQRTKSSVISKLNKFGYFFKDKNNKKIKKCLNCGKQVKILFCNTHCQMEYKKNEIFKKIENGTFILDNKETEGRWVKKYLIYKYGEKCMECGWNKINIYSKTIPIQLEHINGNSEDNNLNNVKLLCPNCHSLTPTFGFLNKGKGRNKRKQCIKRFNKLIIEELIIEKQKLENYLDDNNF